MPPPPGAPPGSSPYRQALHTSPHHPATREQAFIQHLLRCANIADTTNQVLTSFINSSSNLGLKTPKSTEGNDRTTTKKMDPKTSRHKCRALLEPPPHMHSIPQTLSMLQVCAVAHRRVGRAVARLLQAAAG